MFKGLDFFNTASAMAAHASTRQAVVARNIANADTPGFQAKDIAIFDEVHRANSGAPSGGALRTNRADHIPASDWRVPRTPRPEVVPGNASPNGNSVSLETEMIKSSNMKQQHEMALAVYRSGLDLLRTALGRGK